MVKQVTGDNADVKKVKISKCVPICAKLHNSNC